MWKTLSGDATLLSLMSLTGQPATEIAKRIIKRSSYEGLTGNEKRLCIHFRSSRKSRNLIITDEVLQIDCHVPGAQDYTAYRVIERVKVLLHNQPLNQRRTYFDGQLGELPSMAGFVSVGARFNFFSTI